ncbi:LacI family DNA-binding transcriptional regulator [Chryseobacterium gambrini]|uniref:LacI family DNA-binding transcriptional regulator n=1 Tax=Chryseobacterium gambrini TaxID=373672 RepID=A0AAJ1R6B3_9FLAO|nr:MULTISPECIES: LacI family DNA-binding transcriptional regulator [Chryseobacterium]MDN4014760.1 LacI family DNA-binding transcriptional regulator [Chryseobacterium gambrini]MDN4031893.1 LacI family DNA-binding transcriptional regulator [Chryseobacterium gambrini]QWA39677.1 LacI family transcriptional regulator [Chryseobacterium sp. ZHDP1]
MKRVTIKDLAEMLNISVSTVSRALKDHPDISSAVKLRVKEAAETFNYIPNDFAINFRKKSSKVIGLIIPEMSMFFIPSIIRGISSVLHKEGYHFFVLSSEESVGMEEENIITCINSRVDGILISLTRQTKDLSHLNRLREIEVPVVMFDKTISQNSFEQIVFDNKLNVEAAAEKLAQNQCKKILAIFGDENLDITQTRRDFFLQKLKEYPEIECKVIYCESAESVKEKLNIILDYEQFDGYFAMSDETLAGLHSSLIKKKVQTSDVKVIAITEGTLPRYLDDSYECIINDGFSMGTMAASKLLHLIKSGI